MAVKDNEPMPMLCQYICAVEVDKSSVDFEETFNCVP